MSEQMSHTLEIQRFRCFLIRRRGFENGSDERMDGTGKADIQEFPCTRIAKTVQKKTGGRNERTTEDENQT